MIYEPILLFIVVNSEVLHPWLVRGLSGEVEFVRTPIDLSSKMLYLAIVDIFFFSSIEA